MNASIFSFVIKRLRWYDCCVKTRDGDDDDINDDENNNVECENKNDTSNNRGNRNSLEIVRKIPEQHTGKARNQGATKAAILGTAHTHTHTHTLREVLVLKYKTYLTGEITLHVAQTVDTEQLQHCIP
jgi:hypothetical protein